MRNLLPILLYTALSALTAGCERAPARSLVIGNYSGTLNGASESVALNEDGTFLQQVTLPSHQTLMATGTWTLKYKAVDFNGYLHFYDEEKNGALTRPERVFLTYAWGSDMLIRDWGSGYYTLHHR